MYEILKAIAETQIGDPLADQFGFTYARRDYQNLYDEVPVGTPQIFLDPVQITESFGEYNEVETREYSGTFMVLISSDVEKGNYEQRYIDEIKPILDTTLATIKDTLRCDSDITISLWRTVEAINIFDYNMDGVIVTYTVQEDV